MFNFPAALFYALMAGYSPANLPNGYSDNFSTNAGVDFSTSVNIYYDQPRTNMQPRRSHADNIIYEPFDNLKAWSRINSGTASVDVVNNKESDLVVGATLDMQTGAAVASASGVQRNVGSIPSSFGIMLVPKLVNVGTDPLDALNVWIENVDNKSIRLRFNYGALTVELNGQMVLLSDAIAAYPSIHGPEWWIEVTNLGDGDARVCVYTGTQQKGCKTGKLPSGTGYDDGLVQITQQSGHNANRHSQLCILNIGQTQLSDNMTLVSQPRTALHPPEIGNIAVLVEDVSVALVLNKTVVVKLSNDDGSTWQSVTMADQGEMGWGEIGTLKRIHLLYGSVKFAGTGTKMKYRIETSGGGFYPIQGVSYFWQ